MSDITRKLNGELLRQTFSTQRIGEELSLYQRMAQGYAQVEQALAVLSDMRANRSYIYYGGFARILGMDCPNESEVVDSLWEEPILKRIPTEDLQEKCLQELRYFHFMQRLPKEQRAHYYHVAKLRMRDASGAYNWVCHRIFYVSSPTDNSLWLSLCLYNPLVVDVPASGMVVHALTGQTQLLCKQDPLQLLTLREIQVLRLIAQGQMSKRIAELCSISVHTVSRHRQNILTKLKVRTSIEACQIAQTLGLI